jgi:hypothetical protein
LSDFMGSMSNAPAIDWLKILRSAGGFREYLRTHFVEKLVSRLTSTGREP